MTERHGPVPCPKCGYKCWLHECYGAGSRGYECYGCGWWDYSGFECESGGGFGLVIIDATINS